MLVLSRKNSEVIEFPELGITVEVLRIKGSTVRLGINAPPHVRVIRGELAEGLTCNRTDAVPPRKSRPRTAERVDPTTAA